MFVLPRVKSVVRPGVGVVVEQHDSEELTCFQVSGANEERPVDALDLNGDVFWSKHVFTQFKAILEIHLVCQNLENGLSISNIVHEIPHH